MLTIHLQLIILRLIHLLLMFTKMKTPQKIERKNKKLRQYQIFNYSTMKMLLNSKMKAKLIVYF